MRKESRFLIGSFLYRIDRVSGHISQAGNADNKVEMHQLERDHIGYILLFDPVTGQLYHKEDKLHQLAASIPVAVLEEGYDERSKFAKGYNENYSEKSGIRLVDHKVFSELQVMDFNLPYPIYPIIERNGFTYEIDISLREIREVDRPFNSVALTSLVEENGKYQVFMNGEGLLGARQHFQPIKFELDQLVKIAPEEVAKVYGVPISQLPTEDSALRSHPDFIRDRMQLGKLPIIRIVDEDYIVDTLAAELRSCTNPRKNIMLLNNGTEANENDDRHVYLYDYLNQRVNYSISSLTALPPHHVFIVLPDIITLDPVAAGIRFCRDPKTFLERYPIQPRMEARIVPVEKTWLHEQIRQNARQQQHKKRKINKSSKIKGFRL